MKIIHFSDPHAGGPAEDWLAYFDKRWVGVFNYRFRRQFRHDLNKLEKAVEYVLAAKPDLAVCTGDLTSTGQPGEFDKVRPILQPLRDSGIPLFYLPGNHDCYVKRPKCIRAVNEMFTYLSHGEYTFADLPLVKTVGGIDFILLNCSRPSNLLCSWGFVNPEDVKFIEQFCAEPKLRPRVLVSHYPMYEDHPVLRVRHRLFGQSKIIKLLHDGSLDLSLCGHVHKPYLHDFGTGAFECCAGSVTRNGTLVEIDYDEIAKKFEFSTKKI